MNFSARTATIASSVVIAALTGIAAPQMASAAAPAAAPATTATLAPTPGNLLGYYPVYETLKPGSKADAVWELQYDLRLIGYPVTFTSVYDAQTKKAVVDVQRRNRLAADGIVGKGTWQRLGMAVYPTLSVGARGAAVTRLQSNLIGWGYLIGKADGIYGKGTAAAVVQAQRANHLPQNGIADVRLSLALLNGLGD